MFFRWDIFFSDILLRIIGHMFVSLFFGTNYLFFPEIINFPKYTFFFY